MAELNDVIPKLIILIVGIWLAIPSPIEIGILVLNILQGVFPTHITTLTIWGFRFLGVFLVVVDVLFIIKQCREGKYL